MNYEVLTRISPGDDLIHVGSVEAPSDKLAKNYADTTYDEEDWSVMVLVRREDLIKVTGDLNDEVEMGELV
ncbi:phenylacetic acid degradation PaaB family protein (plasmid) [Halobaculum sp. CBA1158]|uniref:phenylacetic acid degradation PaaB family protein n=1 Tax=Halobaculum sp. CBA1158 TaxID=2904243 RepID=UPI001F433396|nr:phenylacetic acid degradation PaaB family protein [Halobaculum sp. CBA1158]UIP01493.1 phenylacetic acid degradation PaaB family protein [Halobaculum sp. CBA1158]